MKSIVSTSFAVALGIAIAACVTTTTAPKGGNEPIENRYAGEGEGDMQSLPNGDYACSFRQGEYEYPPFLCVVRDSPTNDGQELEKMTGSQRIKGRVTATETGFRFEGTFFCPYGSCTEAVSGEFEALDDGAFRGNVTTRTGMVVVSLMYQPAGFGGAGYGGAGYGYGAAMYGGYGYGKNAPPPPKAGF